MQITPWPLDINYSELSGFLTTVGAVVLLAGGANTKGVFVRGISLCIYPDTTTDMIAAIKSNGTIRTLCAAAVPFRAAVGNAPIPFVYNEPIFLPAGFGLTFWITNGPAALRASGICNVGFIP